MNRALLHAIKRQPPKLRPRRMARQKTLFCSCGTATPAIAGLCRRCYRRRAHSREKFAGLREGILKRDGERCRVCGNEEYLAVHHRQPGFDECDQLITLCAGCHTRVHRMLFLKVWVPELLLLLWREQHPAVPLQLQFPEIGGAAS